MDSYKELIVWQKSMKLVGHIYELIGGFPSDERFGFTNQMRRAAVSIPSNIAEGWGRNSNGYFIQFLNVSKGSLFELETQFAISLELEFSQANNEVTDLITEVSKMLNSLIKKLEK